jgi:hypothetical protein
MKTGLLIVGIASSVYGLHWIGQGTGWLPWPADAVMEGNMAFMWVGPGLLALSSVMIWYARR